MLLICQFLHRPVSDGGTSGHAAANIRSVFLCDFFATSRSHQVTPPPRVVLKKKKSPRFSRSSPLEMCQRGAPLSSPGEGIKPAHSDSSGIPRRA